MAWTRERETKGHQLILIEICSRFLLSLVSLLCRCLLSKPRNRDQDQEEKKMI